MLSRLHNPGTLLALLLLMLTVAPRAADCEPVIPEGYYIVPFISGLTSPTSLAFNDDGWLYVTQLDGDVIAAKDVDGNGAADTVVTFAGGFVWPLGLAHRGDDVYVSSLGNVTRLVDLDGDHVADVVDSLITGLPSGRHWTTGLAFGPDGLLYVGMGSDSNRDVSPDPWQGAILRFTPEGLFVDVFATGMRNPFDLAFNEDGELFATDNSPGPDSTWNCSEAPDELNWIVAGEDYGFPFCFGRGDCADVSAFCAPPPCGSNDCSVNNGCNGPVEDPIAYFDPHSSSDGLVFGTGFTGFGKDDLFVAQFGQTEFVSGCPTSFGHRIVHVRLREQGHKWKADPPEDFVTGLDLPLDVTVGPDGALYFTEFSLGRVDRLFATSPGAVDDPAPTVPPAARFELSPNPAASQVRMLWSATPPHDPRYEVFDVSGRKVAAFSGDAWNLDDADGRKVAAGLYLIQARTGKAVQTRKLLVIE